MIDKINVRIYAAAVHNGKLLALKEQYAGTKLLKLPGGGLEFGEAILDCLHREFEEELNLKIEITEHLYTQEQFQISKFRTNEQLLTIYYLVKILNLNEMKIMDENIESIVWLPVDTTENPLELPIDKIAFEKLQEKLI